MRSEDLKRACLEVRHEEAGREDAKEGRGHRAPSIKEGAGAMRAYNKGYWSVLDERSGRE